MLTEEELKHFVQQNNLIGYAISVIFALTLKDVLSSFIGDLLVPGINTFLISLNLKQLSRYLPGKPNLDIQPFIKSLLTFLLTFFLVYLMIIAAFQDWMKKT
jgi:large-conductance mechanosensitive channel